MSNIQTKLILTFPVYKMFVNRCAKEGDKAKRIYNTIRLYYDITNHTKFQNLFLETFLKNKKNYLQRGVVISYLVSLGNRRTETHLYQIAFLTSYSERHANK